MFKKVHSRIPEAEVNEWSVNTLLSRCGLLRNNMVNDILISLQIVQDKRILGTKIVFTNIE